jgi:hypothetical protein
MCPAESAGAEGAAGAAEVLEGLEDAAGAVFVEEESP